MVRRIEIERLTSLKIEYGGLKLELYNHPESIGTFFDEQVCKKSFSNKLSPDVTELDYFYLIKHQDEPIGFIRAIDLFFDNVIELHGSYGFRNNRYIRNYFILSRIFLNTIIEIFPDRQVRTMVHKSNTSVSHFVDWLGFKLIDGDDDGWRIFMIDRDNNMK